MSTYKLRTLWLAIGWLFIGVVIYVSLTPAPPSFDVPAGDKIAHTFAYATLTLWFLQLYPTQRQPMLAVGFVTMGIVLEILQQSTTFRSFEFIDIAANVGGVALGWVLGKTWLSSALRTIENYLLRI